MSLEEDYEITFCIMSYTGASKNLTVQDHIL